MFLKASCQLEIISYKWWKQVAIHPGNLWGVEQQCLCQHGRKVIFICLLVNSEDGQTTRTEIARLENQTRKKLGILHFPKYFIGPLFCWSHASSIVPLKGPSKCLMARTRGRLVGIAKIPRTPSRKYRPPGTCIPQKPSTKQSVYTVFTLWNTESVGISVFWQDRLRPQPEYRDNTEYRSILVTVYRLSKNLIPPKLSSNPDECVAKVLPPIGNSEITQLSLFPFHILLPQLHFSLFIVQFFSLERLTGMVFEVFLLMCPGLRCWVLVLIWQQMSYPNGLTLVWRFTSPHVPTRSRPILNLGTLQPVLQQLPIVTMKFEIDVGEF